MKKTAPNKRKLNYAVSQRQTKGGIIAQ